MTIEFVLVETGLAETGGFRAQVQYIRVVGVDEVVDEMIRQGSTVTRPDILSVFEGRDAAVERLLLHGYLVSLPDARYGVTIKGVFAEGDASFDPALHRLEATIKPGKRLRTALRQRGRVVRRKRLKEVPRILWYEDVNSGEQNGRVTPGGMGKLVGEWLKTDADDPEQGVFFVAADGGEARVEVLGHNKPSLLVFIVPADLPPGECRVQVRKVRENGDRFISTLDAVLTV